MVRRAYVVGGLVGVVVLATLLLSATAAHPLFGGSHPFVSTQPGLSRGRPAHTPAVGTDGPLFPSWVVRGAIFLLLLYAACLVLLIVFHRKGRRNTSGYDRPTAADDESDEAWQALLSTELAEAATEQLADIRLGSARDAIIACWLRLHAATQQAGLEAAPSETPHEFTERMLRLLHVDQQAVTQLAALYREARFSDHPMDARQRQRAADALAVLASDLSSRRVPA